MTKSSDWISATEVASYVYCPESWRLEHGLGMSATNRQARESGDLNHARWQKTEVRSAQLIRMAAVVFLLALIWRVLR